MTMKNQYATELAALAKTARTIMRAHTKEEGACRRQIDALRSDLEKGRRSKARELVIICRRAAVLRARLNS